MSDKIDWETVRKEGRAKMLYLDVHAVIDYCAVVNGGCGVSDPHVRHFVDAYDLPERWVLGAVHHCYERRAFAIIIFSPDFDAVEVGRQIPALEATLYAVKLTRELVS